MAVVPGAPVLRPSAGFCVQTASATSSSGGRWYVNVCKHKLCEMPVAYSGRPVSKDWILANGIGNMQVPFDIGSFRKLKERAEGAKATSYCIDVVFNPLLVQLFMDDEFCKAIENFRPFLINLALKRIEESIGVRLAADKVKLVKTLRYKDGEGGVDSNIPREFADLPGNADCFDEEAPSMQRQREEAEAKAKAAQAEPLIQDITPGSSKPAIKKGFLNNNKAKGSLYGDNGSGEGILPENAGDPLGYIPKGLRKTCKIVDCNDPQYKLQEEKRQAAEEHNAMNQEFKDQMAKDMEKWVKAAQPDKWEEDLPEGSEPPPPAVRYDNNYSRFDKLDDLDEPAKPVVENRDWYFDDKGVPQRIEKSTTSDGAGDASGAPAAPAVKKGFLSDAKKPLYPKGSEQAKAPNLEEYEEQLKQELARLQGTAGGSTSSSAYPSEAKKEGKGSVAFKAPELSSPEFELKETADGLLLAISVPQLDSMQDVELDVTERRASLGFPARSGLRPLQVELPVAVLPTKVRAKFSKKNKQLSVTLPTAA